MDDILPGLCSNEPTWASAPRGWPPVLWLMLLVLSAMAVVSVVMMTAPAHVRVALVEYVCVLLPSLALVRAKKLPLARALRIRWIGVWPLVCAVLVGLGGEAAASVALKLVEPWIGELPDAFIAMMPTTGVNLAWMLFAGALGAGICEEVMFRGVIQGFLSRRSLVKAVAISALLFGLFHMNVWQLVYAPLFGLLMGWMVERSGSLLPAIVAHTFVNASVFVCYFITHSLFESQVSLAAMGAAGVCGIILFIRATRGLTPEPSALRGASIRVSFGAWMAALVLFLTVTCLFVGFKVGAWRMSLISFDLPALGLAKNTVVVEANPRWIPLRFQPGDPVVFLRDDHMSAGRILAVGDGGLRVVDQEGEIGITISHILGKVLFSIPGEYPPPRE